VFPDVPPDWFESVVQPAFARNERVLFTDPHLCDQSKVVLEP
jgi:hypothetical protein